jgi:anti-sigma regulatory factor (Ser/Thr protein kinase)
MAAIFAGAAADSEPISAKARGCQAWPLPLDGTCAGVARRLFRESVVDLGLSSDTIYDGVTMVSELAANTLHAQGNVEFDGSRQRPVTGSPELWSYVRVRDDGYELVCKIFDSQRGWKAGAPPDPSRVTLESVNGRGLRVVSELSQGRWGHHLTRARLGRWKVQGKVVWFALPVPVACAYDRLCGHPISSCEAAKELEAMLVDRGIGRRLVRSDEAVADIAVLSIRRNLTVWCRGGLATWTTAQGDYQRRPFADLIEVVDQVVRVNEELDQTEGASDELADDLAPGGDPAPGGQEPA